jgi:hypothetical protein
MSPASGLSQPSQINPISNSSPVVSMSRRNSQTFVQTNLLNSDNHASSSPSSSSSAMITDMSTSGRKRGVPSDRTVNLSSRSVGLDMSSPVFKRRVSKSKTDSEGKRLRTLESYFDVINRGAEPAASSSSRNEGAINNLNIDAPCGSKERYRREDDDENDKENVDPSIR